MYCIASKGMVSRWASLCLWARLTSILCRSEHQDPGQHVHTAPRGVATTTHCGLAAVLIQIYYHSGTITLREQAREELALSVKDWVMSQGQS